jgi:periplasmic divalent cation tolerance protein
VAWYTIVKEDKNMVRGNMDREFVAITITTTLDDKQKLEQICRVLVEKRLAACAQISGPIKSIYWWNGVLEETEEWMGIMKTTSDLYDEVEKEIVNLHPYEVPEIVSSGISFILPAYRQWIKNETTGKVTDTH